MRLPADTVIVGVPTAASVYWKLAALVPATIVSGDTGANVPLAEVVPKATVTSLLASTGLPKASSRITVIGCDATPAVNVCAGVG